MFNKLPRKNRYFLEESTRIRGAELYKRFDTKENSET